MSQNTLVYIVRHGETDLNKDRRFRGLTDIPLNEKGKLEAKNAASLIADELTAIHTSPLQRAFQTAKIIGEIKRCDVIEDNFFIDINYGEWQGLTVEEVEERFGRESITRWLSDPGIFRFPGGESMVEVRDRLKPGFENLIDRYKGKSVAVVTHMAVIKVCFLVLLELDFRWFWKIDIDNGSVSLFSHRGQFGFVLNWWNRLPEVIS